MHRLPSFTALVVFVVALDCPETTYAQRGAAKEAASREAEQLWQQALAALNDHTSIQAKIVQDIGLHDQHLMGSGAYLQGPPGYHWVSLELTIKAKPHDTVLQQRCDGHFLWIYRAADGSGRASRIDLKRVLAAGKTAREGSIAPSLAVGGLPKLFDAMTKAFRFTEASRDKLDGQGVYVLKGEWQPQRLSRWLPEQQETILAGGDVDLTKLPRAIPDHVMIYLGAEDLFPRRIDYRRRDAESRRNADAARSLVSIRFSDVIFDAPVDRRKFLFDPGLAPVSDETDLYIRNLGLAPQ